MFMLQTEHGQLVQQSWQRQSEKKISGSKKSDPNQHVPSLSINTVIFFIIIAVVRCKQKTKEIKKGATQPSGTTTGLVFPLTIPQAPLPAPSITSWANLSSVCPPWFCKVSFSLIQLIQGPVLLMTPFPLLWSFLWLKGPQWGVRLWPDLSLLGHGLCFLLFSHLPQARPAAGREVGREGSGRPLTWPQPLVVLSWHHLMWGETSPAGFLVVHLCILLEALKGNMASSHSPPQLLKS